LTEFTIGKEMFEAVFMVAPQLNCDVILGCNFLKEYGIQLCFDTERIEYARDGQTKCFQFEMLNDKTNKEVQTNEVTVTSQVATEENCGRNPSEPRTASSPLEIKLADVKVTDRVRLKEQCEVSHKSEVIATERETDSTIPAQNNEHLASRVKCSREEKDDVTNYQTCYGFITRNETQSVDSKKAHEEKLFQVINHSYEVNEKQKLQLFEVLNKYSRNFSEKPGKCKLLKYKFDVKTDQPLRSFSIPVPFAMRNADKTQIQEMIHDDILELSQSDILNPLTVVPREGKKPRICVDARKVNQYTIPDYERTPPLQELLQRFEGAKFISSLDLNSAFLQEELHEESRKYTAFLYDSVVYQYKRVPYGFKNSLPAFMSALRLALGEGNESFVLAYVDDVLVYSKTFEKHLKHLDIVIGKLTRAGFTLNVTKCKFCIKEMKFLGHVISQAGVSQIPLESVPY
jgi:hypothetical protein